MNAASASASSVGGPAPALQRLVWALVFPVRRHRISVTVPGGFLIVLALGIGTAAYNTASNILFITLSLLLACLLLSGLLSWFNLRGVRWRLGVGGPWRAGHETLVRVDVSNSKRWLPTYGLWFELKTHPVHRERAEERGAKVSELLAAAERAVKRGQVSLRSRLEPQGEAAVEWVHRPERRGEAVVELEAVGSLFPFGFLRKSIGTGVRLQVRVWPAQVDYQWQGAAAVRSLAQGVRTNRAGPGEDLLALRKYAQGDSHRLVHWKASARLGQLMVRQFSAETVDGFALRVETDAQVWSRAEQFETLCSFAATLAEDLFAAGRLRGVAVNEAWIETRRMRDVEAVLDQLAVVQPGDGESVGRGLRTASRMAATAGGTAGSGDPDLQQKRGEGAASPRQSDATPRQTNGRPGNLITFAPEEQKRGEGAASPRQSDATPRQSAASPRQSDATPRQSNARQRNLITFAPEGARGVTAYVDGSPTASA